MNFKDLLEVHLVKFFGEFQRFVGNTFLFLKFKFHKIWIQFKNIWKSYVFCYVKYFLNSGKILRSQVYPKFRPEPLLPCSC